MVTKKHEDNDDLTWMSADKHIGDDIPRYTQKGKTHTIIIGKNYWVEMEREIPSIIVSTLQSCLNYNTHVGSKKTTVEYVSFVCLFIFFLSL